MRPRCESKTTRYMPISETVQCKMRRGPHQCKYRKPKLLPKKVLLAKIEELYEKEQ